MKFFLLTFLQFMYVGFSFIIPNGSPNGLLNGLQNGFPNVQILNSTNGQNNTCCFGGHCITPCPFAPNMAMPMPFPYPLPAPEPIVVPARTYYEPVVHNHPPLHKIRNIINRDKKRHRSRDISRDMDYSDTDADSDSFDSDSRIDYYDDFMHVNARRRL